MHQPDHTKASKAWGLKSLWKGLQLTWKHFAQTLRRRRSSADITQPDYFQQPTGAVTLQYPREQPVVPTRGRYKLHNEIDDCILCDKCARICPVDCIEIESIKFPVPIGKTSNGMTKRLYAAKFDIDMAKCCFCGLCTTVCPTECLTMTPEYDYSVFDLAEHKISFANATPPKEAASQC
ncbi:MAG: 4Fe-4S dicluster domain-containing protein [Bacteroidota bacterium]